MKRLLPLSLALAAIFAASSALTKEIARRTEPIPVTAPHRSGFVPLRAAVQRGARIATPADTTQLAWFTFDGPGGVPLPQGWTAADRTAQLATFFHVADGSELSGGQSGNLLPLEGNQSMWLGQAVAGTAPFCAWATLPGYGNNWLQYLSSKTLNCDSVRVSYKVQWDIEAGEDSATIQYLDANNPFDPWVTLPANPARPCDCYDSDGTLVESFAIGVPAGTTQLRFKFFSDGAFSDEDGLYPSDGAIQVDSITIECFIGGVLTQTWFEDFEGETPGAQATDDSCWVASEEAGFGDFADLYSGSLLLQEDPCVLDLSRIWGFFDEPFITNYACHSPDPRPDVGAIRFGKNGEYLSNEIWSPLIDNAGSGSRYVLSFDVYRDLPRDNLVFYQAYAVPYAGGCPLSNPAPSLVYDGAQRDWFNHREELQDLSAAPQIQLRLRAIDLCGVWCNIFGTGACHSHAPLFDNVSLVRIDEIGPQYQIGQLNLFQDTFSSDGTVTGPARADGGNDILPAGVGTIQPADSVVITVTSASGLASDPTTGVGPALYTYLAVWPRGQSSKSAQALEAADMRAIGKRFPLVDSLVTGGVTWYCFRMDSVINSGGQIVSDEYCIDLNDSVFTPGDTICYFFAATDPGNTTNYASRRVNGQWLTFATTNIDEVTTSPMEFTILPAGGWRRGGDILYIDDSDDSGGPLQLYFDTAFDNLRIRDLVDRYDVLSSTSAGGNGPGARVINVNEQLIKSYRTIIWSSGSIQQTVGDGTGNPDKSDDFSMLFTFANDHIDNGGILFSGDNIAVKWNSSIGAGAVNLRSIYMNFNLDPQAVGGDHAQAGEPLSPTLNGVGPCFAGIQILAYGGCPIVRAFDLLQPAGASLTAMVNSDSTRVYALSQETGNPLMTTTRILLSGYGFDTIQNDGTPTGLPARVPYLQSALGWLDNATPAPTGIGDVATFANSLDGNYPNPFNPTTTIQYSIKHTGAVTLRVYNVAGQLVRTLVDEMQSPRAGGFSVEWDGRGNSGSDVSSGVYFYRLETTGFSQTRKMVLLK